MFEILIDDELRVASYRDLVAEIQAHEREISRIRAKQIRLVRELGRRSLTQTDLTPSVMAGRLDISADTARALLETAARTPEDSDRMANLEDGDWTFDRAAAVARLYGAGADEAMLQAVDDRDIAGIRKLAAMTKRIKRRDERQAHEERHVRSYPSLDSAVGFLHVQLGGYDWQIVNRALDERADRFPAEARRWSREQQRADALVAIAQDWLDGVPGDGPGSIVTIMVDAETAARTDCEAGVTLTGGPRIGPDTLDRLLCEGAVEIVIDPGSGRPLAVGPTTQVVPPKLRRFVLNRYGGCTIDGCASTYRLEIHHIVPRSEFGTHDAENLTSLCWWHHHVAVHLQGNRIDPDSPPHRRRIIPDRPDPP